VAVDTGLSAPIAAPWQLALAANIPVGYPKPDYTISCFMIRYEVFSEQKHRQT
jgi:hypothetical protein